MDYEKKLRDYINTVVTNPNYAATGKNWIFGAIDYACASGQISSKVRYDIYLEFKLLEG